MSSIKKVATKEMSPLTMKIPAGPMGPYRKPPTNGPLANPTPQEAPYVPMARPRMVRIERSVQLRKTGSSQSPR
jgi:hypothetical protein